MFSQLITLLTDFGTADYYVAAMKGAILSINPRAHIVDLTHEIPPHNIMEGAFTLLAAYKTFPQGTIHTCVVDPGVGSDRRGILVVAGDYFFIGPDNGLFSYVYDREKQSRVFHLTNGKYFRAEVSSTFHGRDVFAPVAAHLSNGVEAEEFGEEIYDYVRLEPLEVTRQEDGVLQARVIHIDRFGNCVTNITRECLTEEMLGSGARLIVKDQEIRAFRKYFGDEGDASGGLFAIWGSAGFLELAAFKSSAARLLKVECSDLVLLTCQ